MFVAIFLAAAAPFADPSAQAHVGPLPDGRWMTPTQQILSPAGRQVDLPNVRPQQVALSPDGRMLVVGSNANDLLVVDPVTGQVTAHVPLPGDPDPDFAAIGKTDATDLNSNKRDKLSFCGLVFSPAGDRLYYSNVNGSIKVFAVESESVRGLANFTLPPAKAPTREAEVPAGLAVSEDGRRLYVAADLGNRLLELDASKGQVLRSWPVGVAPFGVALARGKAYVSNQGGRVPDGTSATGPAGKGTKVRVDDRAIAREGSVSIIDLAGKAPARELVLDRHAAALAASPSGRYVVVASAGTDTLQVIDTRTDTLVERICARPDPGDPFGAQPSAVVFAPDGDTLYAANATQNAVAVVRFDPGDHASRVTGLIPVGWFPSSLAYDSRRRQLCVGNLKGLGAWKQLAPGEAPKFHTKDFWGTISLVRVPDAAELARETAAAEAGLRFARLETARLPARPGQAAVPVPARAGEPSVFRHVIYVIKENRTYDQMLGDLREGNGDPSLCTFGERYTPNEHALARNFVLLDNTYCSGTDSADGHEWTDTAMVNEYQERQIVAANPRSYPSAKDPAAADALVYASSGFLWDDALAHGRSFRNYGEWLMTDAGWTDRSRPGKPAWLDYWHDYQEPKGVIRLASHPAIESMRAHSDLNTVGWDLGIPDVLRARQFIAEMKQAETTGEWPDFMVLYLPNDHTGGTKPGLPQPGSEVADNDLALGQVVDALSHSRFWKDTCLLAIEDDPQSGWDHVNGYRTTCFVASAYTRRGVTVSTQYNQLSLVRTIELILGLPPLNQMDATAEPMGDCFLATPDLTPFTAVPNQVPLDDIVPPARRIKDEAAKQRAALSSRLPLNAPDQVDDDELNRILWSAMRGAAPYPAWAVKRTDDD